LKLLSVAFEALSLPRTECNEVGVASRSFTIHLSQNQPFTIEMTNLLIVIPGLFGPKPFPTPKLLLNS
jgi:hypothetical protein